MTRQLCLTILLTVAGCASPVNAPMPQSSALPSAASAEDDGTYLQRIDPLGGQWSVERLGRQDFTRFNGWINFSGGGFLNHGAGCSGGYPAFYRIEENHISITRLEKAQVAKCASTSTATRPLAIESERRLASFLDQVVSWSRPDERTLLLTGSGGESALLTQPIEPHPEIAGRWLIESIGGKALVTEERPPMLSISMNSIGVYADCNSAGGTFSVPAPGRIKVTGPFVSTLIGCSAEDAAEDALMTAAITSATTFHLQGDKLIFSGGKDMVVRRPPPPDRRLAGEYAACGDTLLGAYHEGPITLLIDSHNMADNAGCSASYSTNGPHISLVLEKNRSTCASPAPSFLPGQPVAIGGAISPLATVRPDGFGFDEQGRLILRTMRGLLKMCRKASPLRLGD
jgi:heat shock protein HslJ